MKWKGASMVRQLCTLDNNLLIFIGKQPSLLTTFQRPDKACPIHLSFCPCFRVGVACLPYLIINNRMIPVVAGEYKLVLVGDSSVGKSSLLSQFVDGKFDEHLLSTIGVDFKFRRVKVGSDEVKLQIWDTAGQETFRSIVSAYYNSADAILLCYDLSNYETFESLKEYWLPEAQNNNKTNAKVFVIGNKLDAKREVESYSLDSLKESGIHAFFEVSAKDNINVEKAFTDIAKVLHSGSKPKTDKPQTERPRLNKGQTSRPKNMTAEDLEGETPEKKSCCK